jgi:polyphosphate:AMP phosphotransferase
MFESAELGHTIDKATYAEQEPLLREALLTAEFDLIEAKAFPVIILVGGVDGAGKGDTMNLLNAWMDPRHIQTHGMGPPSDEERERPRMWRFWRALPPKGKIGIFFGSWYTNPIVDRVLGHTGNTELNQSIQEVIRFEQMLTDEGALIIKFWFHLSKKQQRRRLKSLEKDPKTQWRVTKQDWQRFKHYDTFRQISEYTLRETSTAEAPWTVVEGADARYRNLMVGKILLEAMRNRLDQPRKLGPSVQAPPLVPPIDHRHLLMTLDLTQKLKKKDYRRQLEHYQGTLNLLTRNPKFKTTSLIIVFEGADAAGKGGSIRRITSALDARYYQIIPIAAPTEEELAQPYLWRFWRHLPRRGRVIIFDRSWYGRVLVERVEGFCSEADWMRAYREINDFEAQLVRHNTILVKYWLTISPEEQLKRFKEREKIGFKRFKITEEDWRNRERWADYERAVCDMVERTSTEVTPWTLVAAEDKYFARIQILKVLCDRLKTVLKTK